ncbi:formyltransferase family protein [Thalassospira sp. MIT1370]|uniref:formyltransferase family protein n=1 Tax=unclassified Thalassospira TaxID=2648997 RepID=UPI00399AEE09
MANTRFSRSYGMVLAPTTRSKMYLQLLMFAGVRPSHVILLGEDQAFQGNEERMILQSDFGSFEYDPSVGIKDFLKKFDIVHEYAPCSDVNKHEFVSYLRGAPESEYIYSGYPGVILGKDLLSNSTKRFLHAHGGRAPRYSGSTAFYYSILEEGLIGATAFWVDEGIDTGEIIAVIERKPVPNLNIDFVQDPFIRGEALLRALVRLEEGHQGGEQASERNQKRIAYHVIHPVLKNCALRRVSYQES